MMEDSHWLRLKPGPEQLAVWAREWVPAKDFFYLRAADVALFEPELAACQLCPVAEFSRHGSYNDVQLRSSLEYYRRSAEVDYVLLAQPGWAESLPPTKAALLDQRQRDLGRGLILADSQLVLTVNRWRAFSAEQREQFLLRELAEWDDDLALPIPADAPAHIRRYANNYPSRSGSNCLSTVLFAVNGQDWQLTEWTHQGTFVETLRVLGYQETVVNLGESGTSGSQASGSEADGAWDRRRLAAR